MFGPKYVDYAELAQQLADWAKQYPEFVTAESIGRFAEGRDMP